MYVICNANNTEHMEGISNSNISHASKSRKKSNVANIIAITGGQIATGIDITNDHIEHCTIANYLHGFRKCHSTTTAQYTSFKIRPAANGPGNTWPVRKHSTLSASWKEERRLFGYNLLRISQSETSSLTLTQISPHHLREFYWSHTQMITPGQTSIRCGKQGLTI